MDINLYTKQSSKFFEFQILVDQSFYLELIVECENVSSTIVLFPWPDIIAIFNPKFIYKNL